MSTKKGRHLMGIKKLIAARQVRCDHCANRATRFLVRGPESRALCSECGKGAGGLFIPANGEGGNHGK